MKRIWLWTPWAIFLLLAFAWIGYWRFVESKTREAIAGWEQQVLAEGGEAHCDAGDAKGFPVALHLALANCVYAPTQGGLSVNTTEAQININLINPNHVILEAKAPIDLTDADGQRQEVRADALLLSYRSADDALAQAGLEADNLSIDNAEREGVLSADKLVLNIRPDPRADDDYQAALELNGLTLARPVRSFERFGQDIAALHALIVVEKGDAFFNTANETIADDLLAAWSASGGQARLEALSLNWGPLEATGTGHIGLDEERRIAGRLDIDVDEPGPAVAALAENDDIPKDARDALRLIATAFALTGQDASFDVEAKDGMLSIENAPVRPLAPIQ